MVKPMPHANGPIQMMNHFSPEHFSAEILFSVIILALCFMIYYKTKEIYSLSRHKGLYYFRNAFLFFGLAYLTRFIFLLIRFYSHNWTALRGPTPFNILMIGTGYLSSMAILYSVYSSLWRKISEKKFLIWSNILAATLTFVSVLFRSPEIMAVLQSVLVIFALVIILKLPKKQKLSIGVLYLLLYLFWLGSTVIMGRMKNWPFELILPIQIFSLGAFYGIYHKLHKWIK